MIANAVALVETLAETLSLAEAIQGRLDAPEVIGQLVGVHLEGEAAGGTFKLRARLQDAEGVGGLLAAARAANVELRRIEQALGHGARLQLTEAPVGGESTPAVESPERRP